jgi:hypothetical protein
MLDRRGALPGSELRRWLVRFPEPVELDPVAGAQEHPIQPAVRPHRKELCQLLPLLRRRVVRVHREDPGLEHQAWSE